MTRVGPRSFKRGRRRAPLPLIEPGAYDSGALPALAAQQVSSEARCSTLAGHTVLVIDDDSEALQVLAAALAVSGAQVHTADSAARGLELVGRVSPSVIVSDISMPGEDGFCFLRKLRAEGVGAKIPTIALTAYAREEDKRAMLSAGFHLHLAKPVDPAELVRTVARVAEVTSAK